MRFSLTRSTVSIKFRLRSSRYLWIAQTRARHNDLSLFCPPKLVQSSIIFISNEFFSSRSLAALTARGDFNISRPYGFTLPEHLKSCSCKSATLWPFNWLGEWHRVYGAKRGADRKNRDNHDRWQSHPNGLSDNLSARMRGNPLNISRDSVVILLLFSVLWEKWEEKERDSSAREI